MRASSLASLNAAINRFNPVLAQAGADSTTIGQQLFGVTELLDGSGSLRRALTDPSRDGDAKAQLVNELLAEKIDARAVELLAGLARSRWSDENDLATAVHKLGVVSVLSSAADRDKLTQVEEELFRLERLFDSERELAQNLNDQTIDGEKKATAVDALIGAQVEPETKILVHQIVNYSRGRSLRNNLNDLIEVAAEMRQQLVAKVTSATVLSTTQVEKLREVLSGMYGREVQLNLDVDPQVIGGLRIEIGAEVVDATISTRLEGARRRFA